jgi:hypothetical protein
MSDQLVDGVRAAIAAEHGLPEGAADFLTGETIDEIEANAVKLAELLTNSTRVQAAKDTEQLEQAADAGSLTAALQPGAKQARQRALVELLHPKQQLRDPHGRFTTSGSSSGGFDGGARTPAPVKGPPEREHDYWLGDVIAQRRADAGASF